MRRSSRGASGRSQRADAPTRRPFGGVPRRREPTGTPTSWNHPTVGLRPARHRRTAGSRRQPGQGQAVEADWLPHMCRSRLWMTLRTRAQGPGRSPRAARAPAAPSAARAPPSPAAGRSQQLACSARPQQSTPSRIAGASWTRTPRGPSARAPSRGRFRWNDRSARPSTAARWPPLGGTRTAAGRVPSAWAAWQATVLEP
mmetsp:Transcript_38107/g.99727  ORF Transcript_38107/g.99727 Transcript_38107/m.99727 type:complete len:200 (-) Transcript_38107:767-1366(-)